MKTTRMMGGMTRDVFVLVVVCGAGCLSHRRVRGRRGGGVVICIFGICVVTDWRTVGCGRVYIYIYSAEVS